MSGEQAKHWQGVYQHKKADEVSWYQPEARLPLDLIRRVAPSPRAAVIDVGAGASTGVDSLPAAGFTDLTVLDLADEALTVSRARLAHRVEDVKW